MITTQKNFFKTNEKKIKFVHFKKEYEIKKANCILFIRLRSPNGDEIYLSNLVYIIKKSSKFFILYALLVSMHLDLYIYRKVAQVVLFFFLLLIL